MCVQEPYVFDIQPFKYSVAKSKNIRGQKFEKIVSIHLACQIKATFIHRLSKKFCFKNLKFGIHKAYQNYKNSSKASN